MRITALIALSLALLICRVGCSPFMVDENSNNNNDNNNNNPPPPPQHHDHQHYEYRAAAGATSPAASNYPTGPDWIIPQLGFEPQPSYLRPKEVVLTFDDGPGWNNNTYGVLQVLKKYNTTATFFVNTGQGVAVNWNGPTCKMTMEKMILDGHIVASHSRTHPHLPLMNYTKDIYDELWGVEDEIRQFVSKDVVVPKITLFRAPYGEPYQWKFVGDPQGNAPYTRIAPLSVRRGVHIGWNVDSNDWQCPEDPVAGPPCALQSLVSRLNQGGYGIVLMHTIYDRSAGEVELVLNYLAQNGYTVKTTEDAVYGQYGMYSADVIQRVSQTAPILETAPPPSTPSPLGGGGHLTTSSSSSASSLLISWGGVGIAIVLSLLLGV